MINQLYEITAQLEDFPSCNLARNLAKYPDLDLVDLANDSPHLFDTCVSLFSNKPSDEIYATWQSYVRAYASLKATGFYSARTKSNLTAQCTRKVLYLESAYKGTCRVDVEDLRGVVFRKEGSFAVEFNALMELIDQAYGVCHSGFFDELRDNFQEELAQVHLSPGSNPLEAKLSPEDSAKYSLILDQAYCEKLIPSIDFWEELLGADFGEVNNGDFAHMCAPRGKMPKQLEKKVYWLYRAIVFKELRQLTEVLDKSTKEILFSINW